MARRTKLRLQALNEKPAKAGRPAEHRPAPSGSRAGKPPPGPDRYGVEEGDRVETAAFVVGSIIALAVLIGMSVVFGSRSIEGALVEDITRNLQANDVRGVEVTASGLNVTLDGTVDREDLLLTVPRYVDENFPVRAVSSELRLVLPNVGNEIVVTSELLIIAWADGNATVTGTMSTQSTVDAVAGTVQAAFGSVDAGGLVVLEGVASEADWLTGVLQVVQRVGTDVVEGQIIVNPSARVVQVAAEFDERQVRADLKRDVEEIMAATAFDFSSSLTLKVAEVPVTVPPVIIEKVQKQLDELIDGKTVEFASGSAELTAVGRSVLDELLGPMLEFESVPIEIAGHTDSLGSDEANLDLSRRRAEAVVMYLVDRGAEFERFVVIGYGETQPIGDNETPEGRAQNRRIEFRALEE